MSSSVMSECTACFETKPVSEFQLATLTPRCDHRATLCRECVTSSLESQTSNGLMKRLSCPECLEILTYEEIQKFATPEIFKRYQKFTVDQLVSKIHNFIWCPLGCGTGMVLDAGLKHTITLCLACNRQFCSRHRVPWHFEHTCDEYDLLLAEPSFRSEAQAKADREEAEALEEEELRRSIENAEDLFAQSLMKEEAAAEARWRAMLERINYERQLAAERAAREAQRQREREAAIELAARKKSEEDSTRNVFRQLTKPCPHCKVPIQKDGGW
ncbi:hypothetical protein F5Y19DRAFT_492755 [Xylariaceae sp. FL1651]|nr:hypothetical protein F5Y19DRAFT_492755 [Xylariaceae sp. FL1651]